MNGGLSSGYLPTLRAAFHESPTTGGGYFSYLSSCKVIFKKRWEKSLGFKFLEIKMVKIKVKIRLPFFEAFFPAV